ncbi:hypothetical protein PVK06_034732 [Gossypium arboreum]|uniref:Uncharacterized protein n=1 Tax=Gossypium arboreum TaxID=29729 RepID=A0ABR0NEY6_GOSAR|nr:hypothetical protein PVK06_034732 [Gossypium arboreum]
MVGGESSITTRRVTLLDFITEQWNIATIEPDNVALPYGSSYTIFYTYFGESEELQPTIVSLLSTQRPVSSPPTISPTPIVSSSSFNDTVLQEALDNDVSELGRGHKEKFPSLKLQDFVTYTIIKKFHLSPDLLQSLPQVLYFP